MSGRVVEVGELEQVRGATPPGTGVSGQAAAVQLVLSLHSLTCAGWVQVKRERAEIAKQIWRVLKETVPHTQTTKASALCGRAGLSDRACRTRL